MQLRVLYPPQFHEVEDLFKEAFTGPLPDSGMIVVAEEDGHLIGFSSLQQIWHAEPVYVKPEWRGHGVISKLVAKTREVLPEKAPGVLITTENDKLGRVLQYMGFEKLNVTTFRWSRRRDV